MRRSALHAILNVRGAAPACATRRCGRSTARNTTAQRRTRRRSAPLLTRGGTPSAYERADCSGLTAQRHAVPFAPRVRRALQVARSGQAGGGACRRKRPKSLPGSTGMLGGCLTLSIMSSAPQLRVSAAQRCAALPMRQMRMQSRADVARSWAGPAEADVPAGTAGRSGGAEMTECKSGADPKGERGGDRWKRERAASERERVAGVSAAARSASSSCSACPPLSARGTCRRRAAPRRTHTNVSPASPRRMSCRASLRCTVHSARLRQQLEVHVVVLHLTVPSASGNAPRREQAQVGIGLSGNRPKWESGEVGIGLSGNRPKWETA